MVPDGSFIAFESTRDGNSEIYVIRQTATDLRRLTEDRSGTPASPGRRTVLGSLYSALRAMLARICER